MRFPVLTADVPRSRGRYWWEILIVIGLSLGPSAVFAIVNIIDRTTAAPLKGQTAALNTSDSTRPTFDLLYQLIDITAPIVPVLLVCYILWSQAKPHLGRLGIDAKRPVFDVVLGVLLAVGIGTAGIGVYLLGRWLGITVNVSAANLGAYWWTVPVLMLSALRSALQEEFIVIGYLYERLQRVGLGRWTIIFTTAIFRGSYHLYQGFGSFVGNFAMGLLFGWLYQRYGRLLPFVIAHFIIDAATFVGYGWAKAAFPGLF